MQVNILWEEQVAADGANEPAASVAQTIVEYKQCT